MTALTHRSYAYEHGAPDNERLEFLGDTVLQLAVTLQLYHQHSQLSEGQMTRVRAAVVRKDALVEVADAIGVGAALRLGKGELQSGGREKAGILADATEALIGAVYQDGGWKAAEKVIGRHWNAMIGHRAAYPDARDAKTELQERLALEGKHPDYLMEGEGPGHARRFRVEVRVAGERRGVGDGSSRRAAEQQAAKAALRNLYPFEELSFLDPGMPIPDDSPHPSPPSRRGRKLWRRRTRRRA